MILFAHVIRRVAQGSEFTAESGDSTKAVLNTTYGEPGWRQKPAIVEGVLMDNPAGPLVTQAVDKDHVVGIGASLKIYIADKSLKKFRPRLELVGSCQVKGPLEREIPGSSLVPLTFEWERSSIGRPAGILGQLPPGSHNFAAASLEVRCVELRFCYSPGSSCE
jgi:hypothetical protein